MSYLGKLSDVSRIQVLAKGMNLKGILKEDFLKELTEKLGKEYEDIVAAEEILRDTIKQFKENNIEEIDVIDLHSKTKLPIQQIGNIMTQFEEEGVVTEHGKS